MNDALEKRLIRPHIHVSNDDIPHNETLEQIEYLSAASAHGPRGTKRPRAPVTLNGCIKRTLTIVEYLLAWYLIGSIILLWTVGHKHQILPTFFYTRPRLGLVFILARPAQIPPSADDGIFVSRNTGHSQT